MSILHKMKFLIDVKALSSRFDIKAYIKVKVLRIAKVALQISF